MTFLSDSLFWKEMASLAYSILFCLIGVGCGVSVLVFAIALIIALVGWIRKENRRED